MTDVMICQSAGVSSKLIALCWIGLMGGCSLPSAATVAPSLSSPVAAVRSPVGSRTAASDNVADHAETDQLVRLWESRTRTANVFDYPLGPGDVIEIAVPAVDELKDSTVRIPGDGQLSLPYLGTIKAAGLTEEQLKNEMARRLGAYLFHPQITLFAKQYRSRLVAVTGSVNKPGVYDLASGSDTLFEMLNLAGGVRDDAAPRVLLLPSEWQSPAECEKAFATLSLEGSHLNEGGAAAICVSVENAKVVDFGPASAPLQAKNNSQSADANFLEIDLSRSGAERYLSMPARPGDILVVPPAGEVLVDGWVANPGHYKITPALTVLGAIAAAGGTLFAAQDSAVRVIRSTQNGEKQLLVANLRKIANGEGSDIKVQENDVVYVSFSSLKVVPYGLFSFVRRFTLGGLLPLVP